MLLEPSSLTVVPLGKLLGNGKVVGLADWARAESVGKEALGLTIAPKTNRSAETEMSDCLGSIIFEVKSGSELGAIDQLVEARLRFGCGQFSVCL
jgi:hypothetical protein